MSSKAIVYQGPTVLAFIFEIFYMLTGGGGGKGSWKPNKPTKYLLPTESVKTTSLFLKIIWEKEEFSEISGLRT